MVETLRGLQSRLRERGMTWQELAKNIGITYQTLYRKRRGQISFALSDLEKISEVLNCTIEDLLNESTKKEDSPAGAKQ